MLNAEHGGLPRPDVPADRHPREGGDPWLELDSLLRGCCKRSGHCAVIRDNDGGIRQATTSLGSESTALRVEPENELTNGGFLVPA